MGSNLEKGSYHFLKLLPPVRSLHGLPNKGSFLPLRGNEPLLQSQGIHGIWKFKVVKYIHTDVPISAPELLHHSPYFSNKDLLGKG